MSNIRVTYHDNNEPLITMELALLILQKLALKIVYQQRCTASFMFAASLATDFGHIPVSTGHQFEHGPSHLQSLIVIVIGMR